MWWPFVTRKEWNQMITNIQALTDAVNASNNAVGRGAIAIDNLVIRVGTPSNDTVPQELIDSLTASAASIDTAVGTIPPA